LPGFCGASPGFLRERALARTAEARVFPHEVSLVLDSAPLDVVLEMAGYFRPIELVGWLGGRTVGFTLRHQRRG
jgi:hypothetical protein